MLTLRPTYCTLLLAPIAELPGRSFLHLPVQVVCVYGHSLCQERTNMPAQIKGESLIQTRLLPFSITTIHIYPRSLISC